MKLYDNHRCVSQSEENKCMWTPSLPCVYMCLSSGDLLIFSVSFLFLSLLLSYPYFDTFLFHVISLYILFFPHYELEVWDYFSFCCGTQDKYHMPGFAFFSLIYPYPIWQLICVAIRVLLNCYILRYMNFYFIHSVQWSR